MSLFKAIVEELKNDPGLSGEECVDLIDAAISNVEPEDVMSLFESLVDRAEADNASSKAIISGVARCMAPTTIIEALRDAWDDELDGDTWGTTFDETYLTLFLLGAEQWRRLCAISYGERTPEAQDFAAYARIKSVLGKNLFEPPEEDAG